MSEGDSSAGTRRQVPLVLLGAAVQVVFYLRNVLLLPMLTRVLGAELFGVWTKMQALANLLTPLLGFGAVVGLTRFLPSAVPGDRGRYLWSAVSAAAATALLFGVGAAGSGSAAAGLLCVANSGLVTGGMLVALVMVSLAAALGQMASAYYQLTARPVAYAGAIAGQVAALLATVTVVGAFLGASLWVPVMGWSIGPALAAAWLLLRIRAEVPWCFSAVDLRRMVRFGAPLLPVPLVMWVVDFSDRYLLSWWASSGGGTDALVGVYGAGYAVGGLVAMVFGPFFLFYTPEATRLWDAGDIDAVGRLTRVMARGGLLLALPLTALGWVYGDRITGWVAGPGYHPEPAVVGLVMCGYCLYMVGSYAQVPLLLAKRTTAVLAVGASVAVANVVICRWLIPRPLPWGQMRGAALATCAAFGLFLVLNRILAGDRARLSLGWVKLGGMALLACLSGALLAWGRGNGGRVAIGLSGAMALGVYLGGIASLRLVTAAEVAQVRAALTPLWDAVRRRR